VLHVIVFTVLSFIEFPVVKAEDVSGPQRPLLQIVTQPAYMVAAAGAMIAFGVMSFVMAASPLAHRGVAGSLAMLTRTIGVVTGAAALTLTFQAFDSAALTQGADDTQAFLSAFRMMFRLAGITAALTGLIIACVARRRR